MKYQFAIAPYLTYLASFEEKYVSLRCGFHLITLTQLEFNGLLAIGKLDRII